MTWPGGEYLRRIADVDHIKGTDLLALAQIPGLESTAGAIPGDLVDAWDRFVEGGALSPLEQQGLEAVVLLNGLRPAFDIIGGSFPLLPDSWSGLNTHRAFLESCIRSVGRVDVSGHPITTLAGSAFMVGERTLLTNRHVAERFAAGTSSPLVFKPGMGAAIDFEQEVGSHGSVTANVVGAPVVSEPWDAALLTIDRDLPGVAPLPLAAGLPSAIDERLATVVGYPALTPDGPTESLLQQIQIFRAIFGKKRLQPGRLMGLRSTLSYGKQVEALAHDCTTLGGSSGSALIDVERECVVGLHFRGVFKKANYAVPSWELLNSGFLRGLPGLQSV